MSLNSYSNQIRFSKHHYHHQFSVNRQIRKDCLLVRETSTWVRYPGRIKPQSRPSGMWSRGTLSRGSTSCSWRSSGQSLQWRRTAKPSLKRHYKAPPLVNGLVAIWSVLPRTLVRRYVRVMTHQCYCRCGSGLWQEGWRGGGVRHLVSHSDEALLGRVSCHSA